MIAIGGHSLKRSLISSALATSYDFSSLPIFILLSKLPEVSRELHGMGSGVPGLGPSYVADSEISCCLSASSYDISNVLTNDDHQML